MINFDSHRKIITLLLLNNNIVQKLTCTNKTKLMLYEEQQTERYSENQFKRLLIIL